MITLEQTLETVTRWAAWSLIDQQYHPAGALCPECDKAITGHRALAAWSELRRVYCASCESEFSPTVGTPLHNTSWQPEELVRLVILLEAGRSRSQIAAALGKSSNCIRDMQDRLSLLHPARQTQTELLTIEG